MSSSDQYVVTVEVLYRESDGLNPNDGSELQKVFTSRETLIVSADDNIGDVMKRVREMMPFRGYIISVTINEDAM